MGRDYHNRILMLVYFGDWWLIFTFDLTLIRPGDAPTHTSVTVFPIGISEEGRLTLNVGIIDSWPGVLDWRKRRKRVKHKNSPLLPSWTCNVEAASRFCHCPHLSIIEYTHTVWTKMNPYFLWFLAIGYFLMAVRNESNEVEDIFHYINCHMNNVYTNFH